MSFHDVRFPAHLSFGALGGPERLTDITTLTNGFEERSTPWAHSRRRYDAGLALQSLDDLQAVIAFFEARQGQLFAFRWKDWADYKSGLASAPSAFEDQLVAVGDGETRTFPLQKHYRSGTQSYTRPITKPVFGSVLMGVGGIEQTEGTHYSVDITTGEVTFTEPPSGGAEITAGFEFDVPVRFELDRIHVSIASFEAGNVPDVPVVEVRL